VHFTGHTELNIDAKGRLMIPAKYRGMASVPGESVEAGSGLAAGSGVTRWVAVPWPSGGGSIRLYPDETFARLSASTTDSLTPGSDEAALEEALYGLAEHLEPDKAGRVVLPRTHVRLVGLTNEVVVVGTRNRLEVRDREEWMRGIETRFLSLPELAANAGRKPRRDA